jgi:MFS family permease
MARPSWLFALAMAGDGLLYALLPLIPEAFGIELLWAGVLLAANRFVRIFAYSHVARIACAVGARRAAIVGTVGALVSTAAFAVELHPWGQLAARFVWGLSFGTLNLVVFAYAAAVPSHAGRRFGTSRGIVGAVVATSVLAGCAAVDLIGGPAVIAAVTALMLACVPLALALAPVEMRPPVHRGLLVPRPSRIDLWAAAQGFVVDGVYLVSFVVLMKSAVSGFSPAVATGLVFALRWVVEGFCAPLGGRLADRFGATRVMYVFGGAIALSLAAMGFGFVVEGAVAVMLVRGLTNTIAAAMVAERSPGDPVGAQAAFSTWRDIGAAFGPVFAGLWLDDIAQLPLYLGLAFILGLATYLLKR